MQQVLTSDGIKTRGYGDQGYRVGRRDTASDCRAGQWRRAARLKYAGNDGRYGGGGHAANAFYCPPC
ncbi:hypothetical protein KCP75_03955 [Salmonella enterica subsp. enterica]|nr:hypothetical protein KCP75_03955 [Salmonella enterica subsp. enterica]